MHAEHYRTSGGVAAELNMPRWKLLYMLERGLLPDASVHVPGRRLFTEEDINRIRLALAKRAQALRERRQQGSRDANADDHR
jgi:DNA-binding transcriptional MerR regulator